MNELYQQSDRYPFTSFCIFQCLVSSVRLYVRPCFFSLCLSFFLSSSPSVYSGRSILSFQLSIHPHTTCFHSPFIFCNLTLFPLYLHFSFLHPQTLAGRTGWNRHLNDSICGLTIIDQQLSQSGLPRLIELTRPAKCPVATLS